MQIMENVMTDEITDELNCNFIACDLKKISLALGKTNKGQTLSFLLHKCLRVNEKKKIFGIKPPKNSHHRW